MRGSPWLGGENGGNRMQSLLEPNATPPKTDSAATPREPDPSGPPFIGMRATRLKAVGIGLQTGLERVRVGAGLGKTGNPW